MSQQLAGIAPFHRENQGLFPCADTFLHNVILELFQQGFKTLVYTWEVSLLLIVVMLSVFRECCIPQESELSSSVILKLFALIIFVL